MVDKVVEIVSSTKRAIVDINWNNHFVYIPMTTEEAKLFAPNNINPCWRITMERKTVT